MLAGVCGNCELPTAYILLTEDEQAPYRRSQHAEGLAAGVSIFFNPSRAINAIKDEFTLKYALAVKCVQCFQQKALCPYCGKLNVASPANYTCKECGGKYNINFIRIDIPARSGFLGHFVED
jgi:hypothetical protein